MAIFFNNVQIGTWQGLTPIYGNLYGDVSRTNNTVTLSGMRLSVYANSPILAGVQQTAFFVNNTGTGLNLIANGTPSLGQHNLSNTSLTVDATQSSATIRWFMQNGGVGSFNITFPAPPVKPTVSVATIMYYDTLIVIYGTTSYGSPNTGVVTLYGGTDPNPTTVIDTNDTNYHKSFRFEGLQPSTTYYFKAVADNRQMSTASDIVSKTTKKATAFYVPVDGNARKTVKMYCSVNGKTKRVVKLYGSVNGIAKRVL